MAKRTARELAKYLKATIEGDEDVVIAGVASPEWAEAKDLIYVEGQKHLNRVIESGARCVIAPAALEIPGKTILRSDKPKLAFAKAAGWLLAPERTAAPGIHPSAVVAASARIAKSATVGPYAVIEGDIEIGENTEIGAHCFLGAGSSVGDNCRVFARVTLYPKARVGNGVTIHAGAVIGSDGFGYVFGEGQHWKFPQVGTVKIEDDVEIGANTTIDRGSLGATVIGRGVKIDNLVHVAHNVRIGEHTVIAAQTGISGSCTIGKNVVMGGQVGMGDHVTVEDGAALGGGAGILPGKIIRAGQIVWGTPARPLVRFKEQYGWMSRLPELARRVEELEKERKRGDA